MLIKTLNIKVSFQWAFEDNQRWTATDHVRQTVPGARCCDGVQCGSFVQLMAVASQCICSWVKMKPYCRTGLNPLHLPLPCVDVAYCYTCCSTPVCSVCSVSSAKTYEPTTNIKYKTLNIKVSFQWAFEDNQRWLGGGRLLVRVTMY